MNAGGINKNSGEERIVMGNIFDFDELAQKQANVKFIKNEDDVNKYLNDIAILVECRELIDYHFPVLKNIEIANEFFNNSNLFLAPNNTPFVFSELNRIFCNCVESYYMFDQLCQKRLKWPKQIISNYYDNFFEFKFISEIRNYSIHHHLPLTEYETRFDTNGFSQAFNIDVKIIIKDKTVEKKLKNDLEKFVVSKKNIDAKQLFAVYYGVFVNLLCDILLTKSQEIISSLSELRNLIDNEQGKPYNLVYLFCPDGSKIDICKNLNSFLLELSGFVDRIGITNLKKREFVNFFLELSRIYLKKNNSIVRINKVF